MTLKACVPWITCLAACGGASETPAVDSTAAMQAGARIAVVEGLSGPEGVRYDPGQDVYFISNFNGENSGDANGFISRVQPDGTVDSLRFLTGTPQAPLHGPRGMFITGDTLWAADADGVHGWDRRTGTHLVFVDFRAHQPGFLNDVAQGPDGALYVTDTGRSRIYRVADGLATIAVEDDRLGSPNGITWDSAGARFVVAPWEGEQVFGWTPGGGLEPLGSAGVNRCDGVEMVAGGVLLACQADSTLRVLKGGAARPVARLPGRPADIGVDTRRGRVAVPYVALNRVDIFPLP